MSDGEPKRTVLHALHLERGAKMGAFAGYDMPLYYAAGVLKEHLHTRAKAGLFDISHMGQVELRAHSGEVRDVALALEKLVPADIAGLRANRQRYTFFTSPTGGILDDLIVANLGDRLFIVCNGARKDFDFAHIQTHLGDVYAVTMLPRALIALQGPAAESVLARLAPGCVAMRFMEVREMQVGDAACIVSRSGYTGEDGYEISIPEDKAEALVRTLLDDPDVLPIGLAARDSLRLEAGLCLYGSDLDETTAPVEADLGWAIQSIRRLGGAREGGFPGADIVLGQIETGAARRRVGLRPQGRAPVRGGTQIFATADAQEPAGVVTSGGFGPTLDAPMAMGYVPAALAEPGGTVFAQVRDKRLPVTIAPLPFTPHRYKRI